MERYCALPSVLDYSRILHKLALNMGNCVMQIASTAAFLVLFVPLSDFHNSFIESGVLKLSRQRAQINNAISGRYSFSLSFQMDTRKSGSFTLFNECARVLGADICQLQGKSCFSCPASQISPTCLHSRPLLNQLSLMAAGGN